MRWYVSFVTVLVTVSTAPVFRLKNVPVGTRAIYGAAAGEKQR